MFDIHQKPFHFLLEAPEGGTAEDVIMRVPFFEYVEEAECVVDGVISAEISCVLLVALAEVKIILGVVLMGD